MSPRTETIEEQIYYDLNAKRSLRRLFLWGWEPRKGIQRQLGACHAAYQCGNIRSQHLRIPQ
jgi:hypothetical protein